MLLEYVAQYYARDPEATSVSPDVLLEQVANNLRNEKHVKDFSQAVQEAVNEPFSSENVKLLVLDAKKKEVGDELAIAITNGKEHAELLKQYQELSELTDIDDLASADEEVVTDEDAEQMLALSMDQSYGLFLTPKALQDRVELRAQGGHHILIYGVTESGKSAAAITMAAGFARQGATGIFFENEDPVQSTLLRFVSCLTGLTRGEVERDLPKAVAMARKNGLNNIRIVSLAPGSVRSIEKYVERYNPSWVVVNQLRNLSAPKSETRTNQLEAVATGVRNIAKKHDVIVVSVTQAGDSASGKEVLTVGDVDSSNVGIPGQVDLMIGIGVTPALEQQGIRILSLPKNKFNGYHGHMAVKFNPMISRMTSV